MQQAERGWPVILIAEREAIGVESEFGTGSSFTIRLRSSDATASTSTRAP